MRYIANLTAREAEIIRVTKIFHPHTDKFIVIGGYAVNALALHRFSVDCDLVIAKKDSSFTQATILPSSIKQEMLNDGQANFIVTGDKHLLELKQFNEIKILTVSEALEEIR